MKPNWQELPAIPDIPDDLFNQWVNTLKKNNSLLSIFPKTFARRMILSPAQLVKFSVPKEYHLDNPFQIQGIEELTDCLLNLRDEKHKILLFGDRDVDGIFSTAMLYRYLTERMNLNASWKVPEKRYGISQEDIDAAASEGVTHIITLDNGITAFGEVTLAHQLGIKFIIVDHHSPKGTLPKADIIVDPKVSNEHIFPSLESRFLCTGGLVFKIIQALEFAVNNKFFNRDLVFMDIEPRLEKATSAVIGGEIALVTVRNGRMIAKFRGEINEKTLHEAFEFIGEKTVAGFNIHRADFHWLTRLAPENIYKKLLRIKERSIDLLEELPPGKLKSMNLKKLSEKFGINEGNSFHDPLFDAYITSRVFFKLQTLPSKKILQDYLPTAAIATLADMVPLVGENKVITSLGLELMEKSTSEPLRLLIEVLVNKKNYPGPLFEESENQILLQEAFMQDSNLESKKRTVIFRLAPVINAAARSGKAHLAVKLMTYRYRENMAEILDELIEAYEKHREKLQQAFKELESKAREALLKDPQKVSFIFKIARKEKDLVGVLASRAAGTFNRPVVVVYRDGKLLRGSARAVGKINLKEIFGKLQKKYSEISFGGHTQAMGIRIPEGLNLKNIEEEIENLVLQSIGSPEELGEVKYYEEELPIEFISPKIAELFDKFQPFGVGNPEPQFLLRGVLIKSVAISQDEKHIFLTLTKSPVTIEGVFWNAPEEIKETLIRSAGAMADLIVKLKLDRREEPPRLRLEINDIDILSTSQQKGK